MRSERVAVATKYRADGQKMAGDNQELRPIIKLP